MSRYIDEISARENFQDDLAYMGSEVKRILKKVPTADVVEVVRCKDCKYFTEEMIADDLEYICNFFGGMITISPDYYCSCGERREE